MNEWTEDWIVARRTGMGLVKHAHNGQTRFHIHDAREHLKTKPKEEGWRILHHVGEYEAPAWAGIPSHPVNRSCVRLERPSGITFVNETAVPKDYDPDHLDKS